MLDARPACPSKHGTAISTTGPEPTGGWIWGTATELPQTVTRVPITAAFVAHAPLTSETAKPSPTRGPNLESIENSLPSYAAFYLGSGTFGTVYTLFSAA